MTETIVTALISGGLTLIGVLVSNRKSRAVTEAKNEAFMKALDARLNDLIKKVEKHNNFAVRIPLLEKDIEFIREQLHNLEKGA